MISANRHTSTALLASGMLLLASGCVVGVPASSQPHGLGVELVGKVVSGDAFVGDGCSESCGATVCCDDCQQPFDDGCEGGNSFGNGCGLSGWSLPSGPLRQLLAHPPAADPPPARFAPVPTNQVFYPQATSY